MANSSLTRYVCVVRTKVGENIVKVAQDQDTVAQQSRHSAPCDEEIENTSLFIMDTWTPHGTEGSRSVLKK